MSWISNFLGEDTFCGKWKHKLSMLVFGLLIMLELAWFSFLPGLARLFCQLSIPQMLLVSEVLQTLGVCGSLCMWKLVLPELHGWGRSALPWMQNPQVVGFSAAGALGIKQSYWAMAVLSDCLEIHNSGYMVSFYFYLHLYISLILYLLTGLNSIKTNTTVIETTCFLVHLFIVWCHNENFMFETLISINWSRSSFQYARKEI